MALKALLDSLDGIGEEDQKHYVEKDGKFVLQIEDFAKHPGAVTLKKTLDGLDTKKKEAEGKLKTAEEKLSHVPEDFNAEEYARLKALDPNGDPDAKKKFDDQLLQQKTALEARHTTALKTKETEIEKLKGDLGERDGFIDKTLAENGLRESLLEVGVVPELIEGALASLRSSVKVVRDDEGARRAVANSELGEQTIGEFVKDWSTTKGKAYLGTASGPAPKGNNKPGGAVGKTMKRADFDRLDANARQKAIQTDKVTLVD